MNAYDPLSHPFELPVQRLQAYCRAEQPLYFPPAEGATPGTTLAGTFCKALSAVACLRRDSLDGHCLNNREGDAQCRRPEECPLRWLYKPYSEVQDKYFPRPVLLRAPALEGRLPVADFILEVTLWGRQAIARKALIEETLSAMGRRGFKNQSNPIAFRVHGIESNPCLSLAERLARLPQAESVLLEFQTPFLHQEKDPQGRRRFYTGEGMPPLAAMLGNVASELTAWDIEDRLPSTGSGNGGGKKPHQYALDSRDAARQAGLNLHLARADLAPVWLGERESRSNRNKHSLAGFVGVMELRGDLAPAMPWLLVMSIGGGGQHRATGFGVVKLWHGLSAGLSAPVLNWSG